MDLASFGYASSGGLDVAYVVYGDGPVDVVVVTGLIGHIGMNEELPWYREVVERVPAFARLIMLDKRGEGLSDGLGTLTTYEEAIDDVRAVMDAVGSERAVILVGTDACPLGILFAATYPDRVLGLVCREGWARLTPAPGYPGAERFAPEGVPAEHVAAAVRVWGTGGVLARSVGGAPDQETLREVAARWERAVATPRRAGERLALFLATDVRAALALVSCPTLVMSNRGDWMYTPRMGQFVAEHIPHATFIELPYDNMYTWNGQGEHAALDEIERFVSQDLGVGSAPAQRLLMTVLFTDLVDSTRISRELGDTTWRRRLSRLDADAERLVAGRGGTLVKNMGDGILATFDGPGRAVQTALALRDAARGLGLEIRAGVHTGEVERRADDIGGLAVHLASRIQSEAQPGEVLVSSTVVDLTIGSNLRFEPRNTHELRGFDRNFQLSTAL